MTAIVFLVASSAYAGAAAGADAGERPSAVILVSCDTLRFDRLGCYGYGRDTSPHLDAWAAESVLFENAICQETFTLGSHMTMLTGLYPRNHRVTLRVNLSENVATLPELLRRRGYRTGAFLGHCWNTLLAPWRGFGRGFDTYDVPDGFRDAFDSVDRITAWLDSTKDGPVFLFWHNYDMHTKIPDARYTRVYDPGPAEYRVFSAAYEGVPGLSPPAYADHLKASLRAGFTIPPDGRAYLNACYDDCVRYVDTAVANLFDTLRRLGIYDSALIIVTSDHGEELGDHGGWGHEVVYEECCHVPLMIRFPGGRFGGRRVPALVRHTDLLPTVAATVGFAPPAEIDGQDLVALLEGDSRDPASVFVLRNALRGIRTDTEKLIWDTDRNKVEYYDLRDDPHESRELSAERKERVAALLEQVKTFFLPPREGWRLRFAGDGSGWKADLVLTTDDRFDDAGLANADGLTTEGDRLEKTIALGPDLPACDLWIRTADVRADVRMSLSSDREFEWAGGTGNAQMTKSLDVTLRPGEGSVYAVPQPPPSVSGIPRVSVAYVAPAQQRSGAPPLSQEGAESLKALGYIK